MAAQKRVFGFEIMPAPFVVAHLQMGLLLQNLSVPLESLVGSRELILLVKNGDSRPLPISAVRVERRLIYLVFLARQPGGRGCFQNSARRQPRVVCQRVLRQG